jgi:nucleoside-triphosphatase THEP1
VLSAGVRPPLLELMPLSSCRAADALLLDEIGRMECLSPRFVAAVRALLARPPAPIVATVALRGLPRPPPLAPT